MKRVLLLAVVAALLVAGCGGDDAVPAEKSTARVYFLRDGKVWPVAREIPKDGGAASAILAELFVGPTDEEADLGLSTSLEGPAPSESTVFDAVDGFDLPGEPSDEALAQFVYTLTQFPEFTSVSVNGETFTRADFEDQTPSVLVESPLALAEVTSPLRAEGTANTFEATFAFTITDAEGDLLAENFVTATSGTGTRGTFEFSESFSAPAGEAITLTVFENSAEDGSRIHEVEIPLTAGS